VPGFAKSQPSKRQSDANPSICARVKSVETQPDSVFKQKTAQSPGGFFFVRLAAKRAR
jgi:hypothetical protein